MYQFNKIAQLLGVNGSSSDQVITHFAYDSRMYIENPKATLFTAIKTDTNDGHLYIEELIAQGVQHFIISDSSYITDKAHFIAMSDGLKALQMLAAAYRANSNAKIIGITGSNGKTICKDALWAICTHAGLNTIRSPRSFNSQLGVALSLLQLKEDTEIAVIEAGVSKPGEMDGLASMIQPEISICTHLGDAHDVGFKNIEEKIEEKSKLFYTSDKVIVSANNKYVSNLRNHINLNQNLVEVSWKWENDLLVLGNQSYALKQSDEVSLNNLSLAIYVAQELGITGIEDNLTKWGLPSNRLSLLEGQYNSILINDSYTSDAQALEAAINFTKQNRGDRKWVAIVTAFEHSRGGDGVLNMLRENGAERIYTVGTGFSHSNYTNVFDLMQHLSPIDFKDKAVLIKGLRSYNLEKVSHWLQERKNTTQLVINLDLLKTNYKILKGHLDPSVRTLVMLKAYAYGAGTGQIARFLKIVLPDYVGVAHVDEGVQLRKAGLNLPILVLYTDIEDLETIVAYNLEPIVYSLSYLKEIIQYNSETVRLHIEFDTGMHRLGFDPEDINEICQLLQDSKHKVVGVMSHLSSADQPELDSITEQQIESFGQLGNQLEKSLGYPVIKHLANSIGTERFANAHFDMVRLGIGLYGFISNQVQAIGRLETQIIQIKKVPAGQGVGYGNRDISDKERTIAILPIGYADGFDRGLGNGKWSVIVNNKKCQTVGNICMDMCMIDVTYMDCNQGDRVILFGNDNTVDEMAKVLGTIPYEIVSRISERVKRVYLSE